MNDSITKQQLKVIEKHLDKLFKDLEIDVEFTSHFLDRLNDVRNGKQITVSELVSIYSNVHDKYGKELNTVKTDEQIEEVIKSINTQINIPFILRWDKSKKMIEMVAKTIMRKANFQTSNKVLTVESFKEFLQYSLTIE